MIEVLMDEYPEFDPGTASTWPYKVCSKTYVLRDMAGAIILRTLAIDIFSSKMLKNELMARLITLDQVKKPTYV